ncbi:MAG: hypothetical protein ABI579_05240 [Candidatus Sumerlaeota bacterium]
MRTRILDNLTYVRLISRDLEKIACEGAVDCSADTIDLIFPENALCCIIRFEPSLAESRLEIKDTSIWVKLCPQDREALLKPIGGAMRARRDQATGHSLYLRFIVFLERIFRVRPVSRTNFGSGDDFSRADDETQLTPDTAA